MKVYVSGTWTARPRLRQMAERLRLLGHEVVSTWLDEQDRPEWMIESKWQERLAAKDVAEVCQADAIILDVDGASTTGGRYVEWGVACHPRALILRVVVGTLPETDIFGKLADHHFRNWNEALASRVLAAKLYPTTVGVDPAAPESDYTVVRVQPERGTPYDTFMNTRKLNAAD